MKHLYSLIILCFMLPVRLVAQESSPASKDWQADEETLRFGCSYVRSSLGSKSAMLYYSIKDINEVDGIKHSKLCVNVVELSELKSGVHEMVLVVDEYSAEPNCTDVLLLRQDGGKVYCQTEDSTQEWLIFDFDLKAGDTFVNGIGELYLVEEAGSADNSRKLRLLSEDGTKEDTWIEGIGSLRWGFLPDYVVRSLNFFQEETGPLDIHLWSAASPDTFIEQSINDEFLKLQPFEEIPDEAAEEMSYTDLTEPLLTYSFLGDSLWIQGYYPLNLYQSYVAASITGENIDISIHQVTTLDMITGRHVARIDVRIPGFKPGIYEVGIPGQEHVTLECKGAAKEPIEINETTFPDENFRNWVLSKSYGEDGVLTDEEIAGVTKIELNTNDIQSLKGIEYFTELTWLLCINNPLTEIDLSKCTKLTHLECAWTQITELDVSNNTALKVLYCQANQLTSLDVSKNTELAELSFNINQLASIDVSKNIALTKLFCSDNQLTELDVSKNTKLIQLGCSDNLLTSLDVSCCSELENFKCVRNRLTTLEVSGCPKLWEIFCYNNQIKGEAMDALIEGLPFRPDGRGRLCVVNTENEQNVMTKTQVAAAKAKGWRPRYSSGAFGYDGYLDYEGIDDPAESVTFTKDQMATIILPTTPDASKGKYYKLDRREDGMIVFAQELQPQARTPYIIVPNEDFSIDMSTLDVAGLSPDTVTVGGISFIGSYVRTELPALTGGDEGGSSSSYYDIIDQTPDCHSDQLTPETFTIGALRAYLVVTWDDPIHQGPTKGEPEKLEIVLHDDETSIGRPTPDPSRNGGEVYDLSGRRVGNGKLKIDNGKLKPGLYIFGGKKVLMRYAK